MSPELEPLWAAFRARLEELATMACEDIAGAWSEAIRDTAPRDTGLLANTAHAEGATVALQPYWRFVAYGHRIYVPRQRAFKVAGVDAMGNAVYARTRPNPFMEQAWDDPRVQAVLRRYAGVAIHIPYPLRKVRA